MGRSFKGVRLFKVVENCEQYRLSINGLTCVNGACPPMSINICDVFLKFVNNLFKKK